MNGMHGIIFSYEKQTQLRELIEQQLLRCGVVMLFEVLLLEDLARALKGVEQMEGDGAVG